MADALGLMCVHAHPDDESITTGGVLARAADEGMRTAVVTCTGGELGEIVGEGLDPDEIRPRLAEVRAEELRVALDIIGAGPPRFLGYRDSGMIGTPGNDDPDSFWRAPLDEAVGRLVEQIRAFRPAVLAVYDAFGGYGHPDHLQTHRVGLLAAHAAGVAALYPEAGPAWRVPKVYGATFPKSRVAQVNTVLAAAGLPSPFGDATDVELIPVGVHDDEVGAAVDVRPWVDRKWKALRAHHSQLGPDSFFLNVPEQLREEAFGTEWFVRFHSRVPVPQMEDDLFTGVRDGRFAG